MPNDEGADNAPRFIAGGTNLVDLMKDDIEQPAKLVDIKSLALRGISERDDGGLRLGALATNAETAYDPRVVLRLRARVGDGRDAAGG